MGLTPAPRTWANGEFVTDTLMNAEVRDNLDQLLLGVGVKGTTSAAFNGATALVTASPVAADGTAKFKITGWVRTLSATVATDLFLLYIVDVGTGLTISGNAHVIFSTTTGGIYSQAVSVITTDVPTAGSHTYRLDGIRNAGTGTAIAYDPEIIVERIS